jgi:predicted ArsR family transcriptional regulator
MSLDLDDTDRAILRALQEDATLKASDIGRRVGLSQPATWRRIKRLTEAGVIGAAARPRSRGAGLRRDGVSGRETCHEGPRQP